MEVNMANNELISQFTELNNIMETEFNTARFCDFM